MQRMLVAIAALAFVAGRYTAPTAVAKPIVTVKREVVTQTVEAPAVHCPAADDEPADDDPGAVDVESTETFRILVDESRRIANTGSIEGDIRDLRTGENLAGVTVIASGGGPRTQVAITDENGRFRLTELEPGNYTVTLYYVDQTIEHRDIVVSSQRIALLSERIDTATDRYSYNGPPPPPPPPPPPQGYYIDPDDIRYTTD